MDDHYNLIILGGGCAGLSLAMRLAELGAQCPKTLIIEKRPEYTNDRTWCFWDEGNPALREWADHTWSSFKVKLSDKQLIKKCNQTPYVMIAAQTFYARAIQKITSNSSRFELKKDESVIKVIKLANQTWRISTNIGVYTANHIIDTRPASQITDDMSMLWQSFIGFEIEVNQDWFDDQQFTLMDIDKSFKNGLGFTYVLPLSSNRALIEYTVFCAQPMSASNLQPYLDLALCKYTNNAGYKVLRKEYGQLPMGNHSVKKSNDPSYTFAGLYAGAARPSSGYAFQRIQAWSDVCARLWAKNQSLIPMPKDNTLTAILDDIFLHVLKSNSAEAGALFFSFFSKANPISTIRFLSDHASLIDFGSIILSMPKVLFLKSFPSYVKKRLLISLYASLHKSTK